MRTSKYLPWVYLAALVLIVAYGLMNGGIHLD